MAPGGGRRTPPGFHVCSQAILRPCNRSPYHLCSGRGVCPEAQAVQEGGGFSPFRQGYGACLSSLPLLWLPSWPLTLLPFSLPVNHAVSKVPVYLFDSCIYSVSTSISCIYSASTSISSSHLQAPAGGSPLLFPSLS